MSVANPLPHEAVRVTAGSTTLPVALADMKLHLRVDSTGEDPLIASQVRAAARYAEDGANQTLLRSTLRLTLDGWPMTPFRLPRSVPFGSSTAVSVSYLKQGGSTWTEVDTDRYRVDADSEPPRIVLRNNRTWPTVTLENAAAVRVEYDAGSTSTAGIDERLIDAIKLRVGTRYGIREDVILGTIVNKLRAADDLIMQCRIPEVP